MKELSIEEKAKAYDEALERAKVWRDKYVGACVSEDGTIVQDFNNIFPELAESEDERIRNEIIAFVVQSIHRGGGTLISEKLENKWIAWLEKQGKKEEEIILLKDKIESLESARIAMQECHRLELEKLEKQGEQKHTAEEILTKVGLKPYKDGDQWCILFGDNIQEGICGFGNTIEDALYAFLKDLIASQGEQKPADKVSLNIKKGDILYEQNTMTILLVYERNGSWLKTFCDYWMLKENFHVEFPYENYGFVREMSLVPATKEQRDLLFQKMKEAGYEWDAEKKELKKIEQKPAWSEDDEKMVNDTIQFIETGWTDNGKSHLIPWLKSLKYRISPQPKQELSEEDKTMLQRAIYYTNYYQTNYADTKEAEECMNWLKSLRPQKQWKPNEEHIKGLLWVRQNIPYCLEKEWLSDLLEQLKAL